MDIRIFIIICIFFGIGSMIYNINKYNKTKTDNHNKAELYLDLGSNLIFIIIFILLLFKIISTTYCFFGVLIINVLMSFIRHQNKSTQNVK